MMLSATQRRSARLFLLVAVAASPAVGCTDPTASDVCALLGEPGQAVRVLTVSAEEPVAIGLAKPGIEILERADDRFQPEARDLAAALRSLERGDDPASVRADRTRTATALDDKVASACVGG